MCQVGQIKSSLKYDMRNVMALLDNFLSIKRKLYNDYHGAECRRRSCQINSEQVRLLLFKECDWKGRKLLFDSSTIEKVPVSKHDKPKVQQTDNFPYIVEISEGYTYLYKGPAADASILGEMIFGAVAINYRNVSLKIHILDEPRRLMCTKVFCVPTSRKISRVDRKNSEVNSRWSGNLRDGSKPLNVPLLKDEGLSLSFPLNRGDSGYCGDISPYSSVGSTYDYFSMFDIWDGKNPQDDVFSFHAPPGRKLSTSSNGSWQRRTFQNMTTRFDMGQNSNSLNVPTAASNKDSRVYSGSSTSGTTDSLLSTGSVPQKKNKLGLALLFTISDTTEMDVVRRCVEHSPQLQALVCRLHLATLSAGTGSGFISTLYRAASDAARWLSDLLYGPRLQPVWLNIAAVEHRAANSAAEKLLTDLCNVLSVGDTKHTNFFISTLLTHVLTYHLGWVTTVSPYDTVEPQKHTELASEIQRPYNALWAQLSDLCGCIGFPPRSAKTVISGSANANFINRLLLVLTYFMRCGDVKRSDFQYQECNISETKVVNLNSDVGILKNIDTSKKLGEYVSKDALKVCAVNTQNSDRIVSTLVTSEVGIKRSSTLANLSQQLSICSVLPSKEVEPEVATISEREKPMTSQLKRTPTVMMSLKSSSDSSLYSSVSEEFESEQNVVFVLGDDEKLVGLKNKSIDGKSVKKSVKQQSETNVSETKETCAKEDCHREKNSESPSKCCGQTLQHSKPIKHSGFKFEFDKYPQIVTNYMKSKNLEILDRHYIGKPGNLKLGNFQFDPTVVPPIQEEKCEACYKCQLMESMLQTPTNASEMEYMNDIPPREPQYAKETIVQDVERSGETTPKTFVRKRKANTVVVNVRREPANRNTASEEKTGVGEREKEMRVKQVIEIPAPRLAIRPERRKTSSGFDVSLLGGVTDHYVPDLILQGTISKSNAWESELRRDLDLTSYLNKTMDPPIQAIAIVGDTNNWEVRVLGLECGVGGMSSLVGGMLDAVPAMRRAKVPAHQCLSYVEGKLREFCVLSKTMAEMLLSTDFCDIATLTKNLNIDINDVPLLLAIAATHTPQVASRYGISYR